ncbi:hypothetical protein F5880DRAFT_844285 [Lentinula raphanica]|nr:hypothetical protein F5880DRAFT_844285 [Lentinula raphanica]
MPSRFPLELYECIIDEPAASSAFLKTSSLVSRTWTSRCRTHLFRRLRLLYSAQSGQVNNGAKSGMDCWHTTHLAQNGTPNVGSHCSLEALLDVWEIRQSIHELTLLEGQWLAADGTQCEEKPSFGKSLLQFATNTLFPNLLSLTILFPTSGSRDHLLDVMAVQEFIHANSTSLEHLCVSSLHFDNDCLQTLLRPFGICFRLSSIQLECITYRRTFMEPSFSVGCPSGSFDDDALATSQTYRPNIHRLSLACVDSDLVDVLFSPGKLDVFQMDELQTLAIHCPNTQGRNSAVEIKRYAPSLRQLILWNHPQTVNLTFYQALVASTFPHLSKLDIHFTNVHDGDLRSALEHLGSLQSPLSELQIGLKYGPRMAFMPSLDRSITNFAQSVKSLQRVIFQVSQMIDRFSNKDLPIASLILQLEIVCEELYDMIPNQVYTSRWPVSRKYL